MNKDQTTELAQLEAQLTTLRVALIRANGQLRLAREEKGQSEFWYEEDEAELEKRTSERDSAEAGLELWNSEHAERLGDLRLLQVSADPIGRKA